MSDIEQNKRVTLHKYEYFNKEFNITEYDNCKEHQTGLYTFYTVYNEDDEEIECVEDLDMDKVYGQNEYVMWSISSRKKEDFLKQCRKKKTDLLFKYLDKISVINSEIKYLKKEVLDND